LPLVGIFLPGIALVIYSSFSSMATYDVFEAEGIIEMVFKFDEEGREALELQNPVPERFVELEYDSRQALSNLATMGVVMIFFTIRFLMLPFWKLINKYT
jgi:hypothetical protein